MRLIASDLDGTIVGHDGKITERTVEAFAAARKAGVDVVFVTGRPPRWLDPLIDQLGHEGTVICSNGAVVYDLGTETVQSYTAIDAADVLSARERILEQFPDARFAVETIGGFVVEPDYMDPETLELRGLETRRIADVIGPDAENPDDPEHAVVKFLARHPTLGPDEFLAHLREIVADTVSVTHSSPGAALIEMAPIGINKSVTLAQWAADRGIDASEVWAFGDMPNDLQMLAWAGKGYAMESGHPEAHSAASHIAPPFDDDGVAQVIEAQLGSQATS